MSRLEALIEEVRPDVVHAGPVQTCAFMMALVRFSPLIVMSWASDILVDADRDVVWRWATQHTLQQADMLLCDCWAVRDRAFDFAPLPDDRVVVFPWGIELDPYQRPADVQTIRTRLGWQEATVVLSTRSLEPIYGVDVVLAAFEQAYRKNQHLRLLLLADGSLDSDVNGYIKKHDLGHVVYRVRRVPETEVPKYFQAADIYVSGSYSDGSSISLLEALAAGLPTIVTDIPGNREWVEPGENGWLVAAGNVKQFASAIEHVAALGDTERQRISQNNRALARSRADWSSNVASLFRVYRQLESIYDA
jgi:glycosyltransferase involved in cell wall biosynthesis